MSESRWRCSLLGCKTRSASNHQCLGIDLRRITAYIEGCAFLYGRPYMRVSQALLRFPLPVPFELPGLPGPAELPLHPQFRKLRESLAQPIATHLSSAAELIHILEKKKRPALPTMLAPFDRVLGGGLERGKLIELAGGRSSGRFAVCLAALAAVTGCGEAAALVDLGGHLDPQIAEAAGVDLPRLLWVRPQTLKQAVFAVEVLIATGFALVVADLGVHIRGRRVGGAAWVRLARSAEAYGAALLVSSPFPITETASAAVVQAHGGSAVWRGKGKAPRLLTRVESALTLEKHRRIITGRSEPLRLRCDEAIVTAEPLEEASPAGIEQLAAVSA
jgi:hypothetical protein